MSRIDHALRCRACGLFGRKRRRRERDADERLLVAFHRHVAAQVRAERRQAWLDGLPPGTPPWQVRQMEAIAHDLALYLGVDVNDVQVTVPTRNGWAR